MASNLEGGGVKVFTATSFEQLEDLINQFLSGNGGDEITRKKIVQTPVVFLSGGTFYCLINFAIA